MVTIEFTDEELVALRMLLHRAVLHSGMDVAETAVFLTKKIMGASRDAGSIKRNGKEPPALNDRAII
jgi:hypothetical protein